MKFLARLFGAVISMDVDEREDGIYQVTVPGLPMFHVIGATKSEALETAVEILKGHIEKNSARYSDRRS